MESGTKAGTSPIQAVNDLLPFEPLPAFSTGTLLDDSAIAGNRGKRIGILIVTFNAVTTLTKVLKRITPNVWKNVEEIAIFVAHYPAELVHSHRELEPPCIIGRELHCEGISERGHFEASMGLRFVILGCEAQKLLFRTNRKYLRPLRGGRARANARQMARA